MPWSMHGKHVFIELTRACNFACDFCPHPRITRPFGVMSLDDLHSIMIALQQFPEVDYVMFSSLGEPMLHPQFEEACRIVKRFGHTLYVTTNGTLLEERYKNTLPVDSWYISYRSTSEAAFAHRGTHLAYDAYTQRIAAFVEDNPQTIVLYLMGNSEWYNREARFADAVDLADRPRLAARMTAIGRRFYPEFKGVEPDENLVETYIPLRPNVHLYASRVCNWANRVLPPGYHTLPREARSCPYDYCQRQVVIYWNGDVSPCCLDYDGELRLGNVLQESLLSLLQRRLPVQSYPLCLDCQGIVVRDAMLPPPEGGTSDKEAGPAAP